WRSDRLVMMSRLHCILSLAALSGAALGLQKPAAAPAQPAAPAVPASALALLPKPVSGDTLHIETNIGSFKMLPKGEDLPAGRLEFSFSGTVLLTGLQKGSFFQTTGSVRKEYEDLKHHKQVFFGKGKILLVGRFQNCQWFGSNLHYTFKGA